MRTVVVGSLFALLLPAGCQRVGPPAAAETRAPSPWQPPCRVPVEERTSSEESTQHQRFVLEIRAGTGGQHEVRLRDYELLELNGEDMTTEAMKPIAPGVVAAEALFPVIRVDAEGVFTGTGPIEGTRVVEELELEGEQAASWRGSWSPHPQLEDEARRRWDSWFGAWVSFPLANGAATTTTEVVSSHALGPVRASVERTSLAGEGRLARWRTEVTVSGKALFPLVEPWYDWLHETEGKTFEELFVSGEERVIYEAELDPRTRRPARTRLERRILVVVKDFEPQPHVMIRELTWDWARAEGCGR